MKICIVGGIFDKPLDYQAKHRFTPETVLAENLKVRGQEVDTSGHAAFQTGEAYDVVHIHHLGRAAIRAAAEQRSYALVFTGHNGMQLCGYKTSIVRKMLLMYVLRRADGVVALSAAEHRFFARKGVPSERIVLIPNGIPSVKFYPAVSPRVVDRPRRILFVGQLIELKGIPTLLKAFRRVVETSDVDLLLVYQTSLLESKYRQMVDELGLTKRVHFKGFLGTDALASLYREVDMLVLPSLAESLPSVITEALLSGLPVVASRVGGIPEQIGRYGELALPGNVDDLTHKIQKVLDRLEEYQAKALEIHEYAAERFGVDRMIQLHLALYQGLATARDSHSRRRSANIFDKIIQIVIGLRL